MLPSVPQHPSPPQGKQGRDFSRDEQVLCCPCFDSPFPLIWVFWKGKKWGCGDAAGVLGWLWPCGWRGLMTPCLLLGMLLPLEPRMLLLAMCSHSLMLSKELS